MKENITLIRVALKFIPKKDRKLIFLLIPISILLGIIDVVGVMLFAAVGTLAYNRVTSDSKPTRVEQLITSIINTPINSDQLLVILTIGAIFLLVGRTLLQAGLSFKLVAFYSKLEADLATNVFSGAIYSKNYEFNQNKYSEYQYALTISSNRFVVGIISSFIAIFTDLFSTILMGIVTFTVSPIAFLASAAIFGLVFLTVNGPIHRKADFLGRETTKVTENLGENLLEIFKGIKELKIYGKEAVILENFSAKKRKQSLLAQQTQWLNTLSRYLLEIAMLFVAVVVAIIVTVLNDARHAVTIMVLFLVVAYRLIPGLQRIQNSTISLRNARGVTEKLFTMLETAQSISQPRTHEGNLEKIPFRLCCENLSYKYPDGDSPILENISFELNFGDILAICGDSGVGKTTLLDLIGGLNPPTGGRILLHSTDKGEKLKKVKPKIGYVSQNCVLFGEDIYEIVSFKTNLSHFEKARIDEILSSLNLEHLIPTVSNRKTSIRLDGTDISGGERQRIAFARSIFTHNQLFILDEPTSWLDPQNKRTVINLIKEMSRSGIVVLVTHDKDVLKIANKVLQLHKEEFFFRAQEAVDEI